MTGTAAGVVGILCLAVAALALEVLARRRPGRVTSARAIGAAMRTTPGRIAVLLIWLWLGVHFLAR